ncbi:MAG TPA: hypothetical protein VIM12_11995 [Noviherbaspirillum sp.]|jgi:hypothetical protein|uniref:hypothetical protein n=1 Tax=Noviherbaspirillum sp. TaxID=1926288 RepID=UPI002F9380D7
MFRSLQVLSTIGLATLLAACGGGGGPDIDAGGGGGGTSLRPTVYTLEGRTLNSCSLDPVCSGNPLAPFFAGVSQAPAAGATVSGVVRLEVRGNDLYNVELLPANSYLPRYGIFNITGDRTLAWLDLDTTRLPNGPLNVRISAFNSPAGQPGNEIVAMPARTWTVSNSGTPSTTFAAAVTTAPANGATVTGTTRIEITGSGIANAELLPASGYTPRLGVFNVSADRTRAWLDFDSRSVPDGARGVRVAAYNVMAGQPGASEIIAMPARNWTISNGSAPAPATFTANVTMAPGHGAVIAGTTRLEVRGTNIRNVELLPANGYLPRYGVFNVSADRTFAWLDFNSSALPNGLLDVRISAFNSAPGEPGSEIIAMPARQWDLRH